MKCPTCRSDTDSIKSVIRKGVIVTGCDNCIHSELQMGSGTTSKYYKREQQTKFRRELTQPVSPRDFIQAYPEKAREMYSEETFRKNSI